ncbi:MAG TPA: hypothetical protein VKR06_36450 [Ktedonosporobacter sp.]|nr:hypothetical protein [Ktedonosporobacter sp.]
MPLDLVALHQVAGFHLPQRRVDDFGGIVQLALQDTGMRQPSPLVIGIEDQADQDHARISVGERHDVRVFEKIRG